MIEVRIRMRLKDRMGNVSILDCTSDDWGIMRYQLAGRNGVPFAISNLQTQVDLPATTDGYESAKELVPDIMLAVESGAESVESIVFAKWRAGE